jgi:hypothetical protein
MARRSILGPVLAEQPLEPVPAPPPPSLAASEPARSTVKPSRQAKLHIGGYFDPEDPTINAFQKLRVDLRQSQQAMLLEALRDFVAKHRAASAFGKG